MIDRQRKSHPLEAFCDPAGTTPVKGAFRKLNQVADDEQKGVVNCSTLFVQVGNGQFSGDAEILGADGYLHRSLSAHLRGWLLP